MWPAPTTIASKRPPRRSGSPFALPFQCPAAHEAGLLVELHREAQAGLGRRDLEHLDLGVGRRHVVDIDQHQARLDPRHVERQQAGGLQAVGGPSDRERIPQRLRVLRGNPELVAEVAGVAGTGHGDRRAAGVAGQAAELTAGQVEVAHPGEVDTFYGRLGDRPRPRSLERQHAGVGGNVTHLDIHAPTAVLEPAQARRRGADQEPLALQPLHVAVLQQMAVLVAPRRVHDPADAALREVARHDAVEQALRVGAPDLVLEQRRHVDQSGRVADRPVVAVRRRLVAQGAGVARPVAPGAALAQSLRTAVERRPQRLQRVHAVAAQGTLAATEAALGQPTVALRVRVAANQSLRLQHTEQPVRRRRMESVRRGEVRQPMLRLLRRERPVEGQRPLDGLRSLWSPARHGRMISHGGSADGYGPTTPHGALSSPPPETSRRPLPITVRTPRASAKVPPNSFNQSCSSPTLKPSQEVSVAAAPVC